MARCLQQQLHRARSEPIPPLVSLLTPTHNRGDFLGILADCIYHQTIPLRQVEWIVLDDSTDPREVRALAAWFDQLPLHCRLHRLLFVHVPRKLPIGHKRNLCKMLSRGAYCVHMDDDDYYAPHYVETVLDRFRAHPQTQLVGATTIYFMYPSCPFLWQSGPFHARHSCAGVLSYTRAFANEHDFPHDATRAEERSFLDNYTHAMVQLSPSYSLYIALAHGTNTVDKKNLRRWRTPLQWPAFVHHHALYAYLRYYHAHGPQLAQPPPRHLHTVIASANRVYAMNLIGAFHVRTHLVHILVNLLHHMAHVLIMRLSVVETEDARQTPSQRHRCRHMHLDDVAPLYPRRMRAWHLPDVGHTHHQVDAAIVLGNATFCERTRIECALREPHPLSL